MNVTPTRLSSHEEMPMKTCEEQGCDRKYYSLGWCNMHYQRRARTERAFKQEERKGRHVVEVAYVTRPEDVPLTLRKAFNTGRGYWGGIYRHPNLDKAACAGLPLEIFFPENASGCGAYMGAKDVCSTCPVKQECAEWGIAAERDGMFGGLTPNERKAIRSERGQECIDPFNANVYGDDEFDHAKRLDRMAYERSMEAGRDETSAA